MSAADFIATSAESSSHYHDLSLFGCRHPVAKTWSTACVVPPFWTFTFFFWSSLSLSMTEFRRAEITAFLRTLSRNPSLRHFVSRCATVGRRERCVLMKGVSNEESLHSVSWSLFFARGKERLRTTIFSPKRNRTKHSISTCCSGNIIAMYQTLLTILILWPILSISSLQIPRIDDVALVPIAPANITTLNSTCQQCICAALANHSAALNCFGNNTCQLFDRVPLRYRLQPVTQSKLYFPTGSLPNASQCCMPDLNALLTKLNNATRISVNQNHPRCLALDNHDYIVTIPYQGNAIRRFHALNLTFVDQINLTKSNIQNLAFDGHAYYTSSDNNNTIEMLNSNNLSAVNLITHPNISGVRDMIFLRDGQIMVVASAGNQKLVFFNRSNSSSVNYTYSYSLPTSYLTPHGLWYVNDSFFHATSWDGNSVYSYATTNGVNWNSTLFANLSTVVNGNGVSHVTVDECGRRWVSRENNIMIIYDGNGTYIGNFTLSSDRIFDALFTDNYVMYLSNSSGGRIIRLDPHLACWTISVQRF